MRASSGAANVVQVFGQPRRIAVRRLPLPRRRGVPPAPRSPRACSITASPVSVQSRSARSDILPREPQRFSRSLLGVVEPPDHGAELDEALQALRLPPDEAARGCHVRATAHELPRSDSVVLAPVGVGEGRERLGLEAGHVELLAQLERFVRERSRVGDVAEVAGVDDEAAEEVRRSSLVAERLERSHALAVAEAAALEVAHQVREAPAHAEPGGAQRG